MRNRERYLCRPFWGCCPIVRRAGMRPAGQVLWTSPQRPAPYVPEVKP
jgi:hypothetical protein